jgi:hypothetical protein
MPAAWRPLVCVKRIRDRFGVRSSFACLIWIKQSPQCSTPSVHEVQAKLPVYDGAFITWYCSEPRLALNRAVVLRFQLHLESLGLAAGTINQRLAAVRRLAYEAANSGLLSPELAAGIRRVKGVKQLGSRSGNRLNRDQARCCSSNQMAKVSAVAEMWP